MKVIFLDIDGVLNSAVYDRAKSSEDGNIDVTRLPLLLKIVEETGAKIVLSSTWRVHFDTDEALCDSIGQELIRIFGDAGLVIYDKTPKLGNRADEVRMWLEAHDEVGAFVILDDIFFGWGDLQKNLVRTNYHIGRGLEERHSEDAVKILNNGA